MRSSVAVALVAVCGLGLAAAEAPAISTDNLRTHLQFLSSDEMRGRANGSPELERAAEYIAEQFEDAGLRPGGVDGWFQPFEVVAGLNVGPGNELSHQRPGQDREVCARHELLPARDAGHRHADAAGGSGRVCSRATASRRRTRTTTTTPRLDVEGKAVVIFSHEPQERSTSSRLNGARPLPQTTLDAKAAAARARGARSC